MSLFWFGANDGYFGPPLLSKKAIQRLTANEIFHGGVTFNGCGRRISSLSLKMHAGWCQQHARWTHRVSSFPTDIEFNTFPDSGRIDSLFQSNWKEFEREFYSLNLSLHDLISFPVVLPLYRRQSWQFNSEGFSNDLLQRLWGAYENVSFPSTMSFIQFLLLVPGPKNDGNLLPESARTCETSIFTVERGKNVERRLLPACFIHIRLHLSHCEGIWILRREINNDQEVFRFFSCWKTTESACLRFDGNLRDAFGSICYTL